MGEKAPTPYTPRGGRLALTHLHTPCFRPYRLSSVALVEDGIDKGIHRQRLFYQFTSIILSFPLVFALQGNDFFDGEDMEDSAPALGEGFCFSI